jgi:hypothetical protein
MENEDMALIDEVLYLGPERLNHIIISQVFIK